MPLDDSTASIHKATEEYLKTRRIALAVLPLSITAGVVLIVQISRGFNAQDQFLVIALCCGQAVAQLYLCGKWLRNQVSDKVMTILVGALGEMTYQRSPKNSLLYEDLPILPDGQIKDANDLIQGKLNGAQYSAVEFRIRQGSGDDASTVFKGMVSSTQVPDGPFVKMKLPEGEFSSFFANIFGQEKQTPRTTVSTRKGLVECFAEADLPFQEYFDAIAKAMPRTHNLIGIYRKKNVCWLALSSNHDCFEIGGLLSGRAKVAQEIDAALQELKFPAEIALAVQKADILVNPPT